MSAIPIFPKILTRYISIRFFKYLILCLIGLTFIYLLVEFFERLDNLMAQSLSFWVMTHYLSLRLPQVIFQILPPAILMATLLTLGGMSKDKELIAFMVGGFSPYQIILPLIVIFFQLSLFSGLYQEFWAPEIIQKSQIILSSIKGEKQKKKLSQGRI